MYFTSLRWVTVQSQVVLGRLTQQAGVPLLPLSPSLLQHYPGFFDTARKVYLIKEDMGNSQTHSRASKKVVALKFGSAVVGGSWKGLSMEK